MNSAPHADGFMADHPTAASVCAVIVTYHPRVPDVAACVACLRARGTGVVVVDNGSDASTVAALHNLGESLGARILPLGANVGIGGAQNAGIREAVAGGWRFVLLLDHDSLPADDMVERLLLGRQRLAGTGSRVAAVGPVVVDSRTGVHSAFVCFDGARIGRRSCTPGKAEVQADFLIASGMLISTEVLDDVGGMSEDLFIDHVDTEWCLRARNKGYAMFGICDAQLQHTLGDRVVRVWLGRWREISVHSPTRHYYVFRNTVLMLKRTPMPMAWKVAQVLRLAQFLLFFGVVGTSRIERLRYMLRGIADGLRNRGGAICV
ncbi:rhamnosyltransferase [compost metagenome]